MKTLAQFYKEVTGNPADNEFLKEQLNYLYKYTDKHGQQELDKHAHEITYQYVELVLKGKWKNNRPGEHNETEKR